MIRFNDNQGLKKLFRLMLIGTVISLILIFGFNYLQEEKYPKPQFNEEIGGNVVNLSSYQSVLKVALDNGNRYMIVDSRNYAYDEYLLQKLVKKGDYLEKKSNSDTLRVMRKKNSFMFVIGEDLNIAQKKSEKSDLQINEVYDVGHNSRSSVGTASIQNVAKSGIRALPGYDNLNVIVHALDKLTNTSALF